MTFSTTSSFIRSKYSLIVLVTGVALIICGGSSAFYMHRTGPCSSESTASSLTPSKSHLSEAVIKGSRQTTSITSEQRPALARLFGAVKARVRVTVIIGVALVVGVAGVAIALGVVFGKGPESEGQGGGKNSSPDQLVSNGDESKHEDVNKLTTWKKAVIGVTVVVGVGLLAAGVWFFSRRYRDHASTAEDTGEPIDFSKVEVPEFSSYRISSNAMKGIKKDPVPSDLTLIDLLKWKIERILRVLKAERQIRRQKMEQLVFEKDHAYFYYEATVLYYVFVEKEPDFDNLQVLASCESAGFQGSSIHLCDIGNNSFDVVQNFSFRNEGGSDGRNHGWKLATLNSDSRITYFADAVNRMFDEYFSSYDQC
jgi:flagellar basal body-associated protein FliL